jgi:Uma2 family endonuclease
MQLRPLQPLDWDSELESLFQSPRLPQYLSKLQTSWRAEQERRNQFQNELKQYDGRKVEFINGEVVLPMSVKKEHADVLWLLLNLLKHFVLLRGLGYVGYEKIMISLERNDYEPDICFFGKAKADGFKNKQVRFPAPDFVVEVLSPDSETRDRVTKFYDYAANGVLEYWVIDPEVETIDQFILCDGAYELKQKSSSGQIRSEAVAGFEIPVRAVFDAQENLQALQKILAP